MLKYLYGPSLSIVCGALSSATWTFSLQTYNVDRMTADSAGTATAYLTGVKTRFGVVGMNQNVVLGNCSGMPDEAVNSVLVDSKKGRYAMLTATHAHCYEYWSPALI